MPDARICKVLARWDQEGEVWVATSNDVKGLSVAAPSDDELTQKLKLVIPDLLIANEGSVNYDAFAIDFIRKTLEQLAGNDRTTRRGLSHLRAVIPRVILIRGEVS